MFEKDPWENQPVGHDAIPLGKRTPAGTYMCHLSGYDRDTRDIVTALQKNILILEYCPNMMWDP